jgi:hypothetical protein
MEPARLSFMLKAIHDVLPTPTNLVQWKMTEDPNCKMCGEPSNLEHILFTCQKALTQGRYTRWYDQVLSVIADKLEKECKRKREVKTKLNLINFKKEGRA